MIDLVSSIYGDLATDLIKQWIKLRETKKEQELQTPEWQRLEQSYLKHLRWRFEYPSKVFGQQMFVSWLITVLVVALVVCGVVFSFLQLKYALSVGDLSSLQSEVEMTTAGKISINSSIIGAVTLVISLMFFNLYLKHVFQIKHPTPPHVSLADTDAAKLWKKIEKKISSSSSSESSDEDE